MDMDIVVITKTKKKKLGTEEADDTFTFSIEYQTIKSHVSLANFEAINEKIIKVISICSK